MAEKKKKDRSKIQEFRKKILSTDVKGKDFEKMLKEGLSHVQAEIRALAAKLGAKHFDRKWVKQHLAKLGEKDTSQKVVRVISRFVSNDVIQKNLTKLKEAAQVMKGKGKSPPPAAAPDAAPEGEKPN